MKNNKMYTSVFKAMSRSLSSKHGVLRQEDISEVLNEWKNLVEVTPKSVLKTILLIETADDITNLADSDWVQLRKDLESNFIVRIESGVLVTGNNQRKRENKYWWTSIKKHESDKYYFNNYFSYMTESLPRDVLNTIDEDTDVIMNNLEDPDNDSFSIKGLVVGHVQSGKTSNYAALLCKAADAGYRFIVVIAGAQTILRNQTQARLEEVFIGLNGKGVGSLPGFSLKKMPICPTTKHDFKKDIAKSQASTNFENNKSPILVVIKKHTNPLDNLLEWLNDAYSNQIDVPMLVIDDESDYASVNTKKETDPTAINQRIRSLLKKFKKSAYVAYTATPFANIFIDHKASNEEFGEDLFPSDFIYALDAPDNYFGAEAIFGNRENENNQYVNIITEDEVLFEEEKDDIGLPIQDDRFIIRHKKDYQIDYLPDSLYEAINRFILNIGIRNLRNQREKHNSMLIHISRFTNVHIQIKNIVKPYVDALKKDILSYGKLGIISTSNLKYLKDVFEKKLNYVEFSFKEVLSEITDVIETLQVIDVHQNMKLPLVYLDGIQTNAIVIGGLSLSRGFTLEGLSVSYFLRTTIYYDTLMQMGRWFGYRIGYQDLCCVYVTEEMESKFGFIVTATAELIERLKDMKEQGLTPEDFGLAVQQHPDSLVQITGRNKAKNAESMFVEMDLRGTIKETSFISNRNDYTQHNITIVKNFITRLQKDYTLSSENHFVWKNVSQDDIKSFVDKFKYYPKDTLGLRSRMPIAIIKKFIEENPLDWDVVIYNGACKDKPFVHENINVKYQLRTVIKHSDSYQFSKSQVARAAAESILVDEEHRKKKPSEMRMHMTNPAIFIHIFKINGEGIEGSKEVIGLSFSFPGRAQSNPTKLLINTVMKEEINKIIQDSENDEDVLEDE